MRALAFAAIAIALAACAIVADSAAPPLGTCPEGTQFESGGVCETFTRFGAMHDAGMDAR